MVRPPAPSTRLQDAAPEDPSAGLALPFELPFELPPWAWALVLLSAAALGGLVVHLIAFAALVRFTRRTRSAVDEILVRHLRRPSRWLFPLLGIQFALPAVDVLGPDAGLLARHALSLALVAVVTWVVLAALRGVEEAIKRSHALDVADNLDARRVHTQIEVLTKALTIFVMIVGLAVALMTFPRVRELGASLLASAGIAGLALGIAARPVLENVIAGIQIALAQPIRIDDVVIVEGEWGRIEEITATYVVVRIWDQRRLIVPFSRFIAQPFQNWTRVGAELLGTIFVEVDYTADVDEVRRALCRLTEAEPTWDGRVCGLVVTDARDRTLQLRGLVSAANSGDAWDLRVALREKLVAWLRTEHPEWLPRTRVRVDGPADEATAAAAGADLP